MPLFKVKRQFFTSIQLEHKTIELRKEKPKKGNSAVFQCGRDILKGHILRKEEGMLNEVLREDNYKQILPLAQSLEEAVAFVRRLYGVDEKSAFTAYHFRIEQEHTERNSSQRDC